MRSPSPHQKAATPTQANASSVEMQHSFRVIPSAPALSYPQNNSSTVFNSAMGTNTLQYQQPTSNYQRSISQHRAVNSQMFVHQPVQQSARQTGRTFVNTNAHIQSLSKPSGARDGDVQSFANLAWQRGQGEISKAAGTAGRVATTQSERSQFRHTSNDADFRQDVKFEAQQMWKQSSSALDSRARNHTHTMLL